jgi:uncharacterized protein
MAVFDRDYARQPTIEAAAASFSQRVYGWMTLGLGLTAAVALWVVKSGAYLSLLPYAFMIGLGTVGLSFAINAALTRATFQTMALLFLAYSGLQGVFFGSVLPVYAAAIGGHVVWIAFLTAGVIFGISVLYGLLTKTDLTRYSRILALGVFGLLGLTLMYVVASLFTSVPGMVLLISYVGLVLFVALTAFDAQQIRRMSLQVQSDSLLARKLSLMMALKMYLNVIMIFWYLLQILASNSRK